MLPRYKSQVELLVSILPAVAKVDCFALKGGTAINLFVLELPRLSVDIDLTYLPIQDRPQSLKGIDHGMDEIAANIRAMNPGLRISRILGGGGGETRLQVSNEIATIKIETTPVIRGTIHDPQLRAVSSLVEETFGFAEMKVVDEKDLFAGKMVAAFDRQHPRDIFDMMKFRESKEIDDNLLNTFLIYTCFSPRPVHEVIFPNIHDIEKSYMEEFSGMTSDVVTLDQLIEARANLYKIVQSRITDERLGALVSILNFTPELNGIGMSHVTELPALKWKMLNLEKLKAKDPEKHGKQITDLTEAVLAARPGDDPDGPN